MPVTRAGDGPSLNLSIISRTALSFPAKTASTVPSSIFFTHPLTAYLFAVFLVKYRNPTPCTLPSILRCLMTDSLSLMRCIVNIHILLINFLSYKYSIDLRDNQTNPTHDAHSAFLHHCR